MVVLVVAVLTAAAAGCAVVRVLPFLIADDAGMRLLRPSARSGRRRKWRPEPVLVACGVVLSVAVPLAWAALSPGGAVASVMLPSAEAGTGIDRIVTTVCLGLGIGAVAGVSPLLAWIDVRIHRLPDRIVLPLLALTAVCWAVAALSGGAAHLVSGRGLLGHGPGVALGIGAVSGALVLVVSVIGGRGRGLAIGLGDVKLAVLLGALTGLAGTGAVLAAFVVAQLSAFLDAGWQVLVRRRGLATRLAYGPHLLVGMWTGPLVHAALR